MQRLFLNRACLSQLRSTVGKCTVKSHLPLSEFFFLSSRSGSCCCGFAPCRGTSAESKVLRDKLYRSREHYSCASVLGSTPEFPFSLNDVKEASAGASVGAGARQTQQPTRSEPAATTSGGSNAKQPTQQNPTVSVSEASIH